MVILRPAQFNICISDTDSRIKCTLSRSADDTKLTGAADTPERQDTMQRDLDRLEKWGYVSLLRFKQAKCKALHLVQGNP